MIPASEMKNQFSDIVEKIDKDIEIVLDRIQKKINDSQTKRLYIPERNIPFGMGELFAELTYQESGKYDEIYLDKLKEKLNKLGYNFYKDTWESEYGPYHLTWKW